jgi:GNAT superfamily N-acetyltransferase
MAFVITVKDKRRGEQVIADARYVVDAHAVDSAEFALVVDDHWQRRGLGRRAVQALTSAAQQAGIRWLHGDVRARNVPMLSLMRRCSFSCTPDREDEDIVHAETSLGGVPWAGPLASRRQGLRRWLAWRSLTSNAAQAAQGARHVE